MFTIVLVACVTNSVVAQFCSSLCRKTSVSLMATYSTLLFLYAAPTAVVLFLQILEFSGRSISIAQWTGVVSPFMAVFALPLNADLAREGLEPVNVGNLWLVFAYFVVSLALNAIMVATVQWRLSQRSEWGD